MLKKSTKALLRIAKRERPKAVKAEMKYGYFSNHPSRPPRSTIEVSRKVARKTIADRLRYNRKQFGNTAARRSVLIGHGY